MPAIKIIPLMLVCLSLKSDAKATWTGKLDLGSPAQGYILRDVKNGQWRGGYNKNLWSLNRDNVEVFSLGYSHTWNTEHGNSALGPSIGKTLNVEALAASAGYLLNVDPDVPPFVRYIAKITSIHADFAYMPVHSADVKGPFIGGIGASLDLSDIFGVLQKGL